MIEQIPPRHRGEVIDEAESLTMEMPDLMSSGIGNASRLLFTSFSNQEQQNGEMLSL